ncbi:hypothetical protein DX914_09565 [Lysobacter silvisoli]|uniref:CHAT domain-containing protein n=1 Tax=Lysobacter silvisoli TaxID=2293254 RepID=A0A371K5U4_9GAMM|nr:hypothetical protein DX914_09565 [Lysobacter silvisoli]
MRYIEDLLSYQHTLERLSAQGLKPSNASHQPSVQRLATHYAQAKRSDRVEALADDLAWLSMRATGQRQIDGELRAHSQAVARRLFGQPWRLDQVKVLATGLSAPTVASIRRSSRTDARTDADLLAIERALGDGAQQGTASWNLALERALSPFRGQLLILVAHHQAGTGEHNSHVSIGSENGRTVQVPVDLLMKAAKASSVHVFLLGCATAASSPLGTHRPIKAEQAEAGIAALFARDIATYGDIYQRLSGDRITLIFDITLAMQGLFPVLPPNATRPADEWRIPLPHWNIAPAGIASSRDQDCMRDLDCAPAGYGDRPLIMADFPMTAQDRQATSDPVDDSGPSFWDTLGPFLLLLPPGLAMLILFERIHQESKKPQELNENGEDTLTSSLRWFKAICVATVTYVAALGVFLLYRAVTDINVDSLLGALLAAWLTWWFARNLSAGVRSSEQAIRKRAPRGFLP